MHSKPDRPMIWCAAHTSANDLFIQTVKIKPGGLINLCCAYFLFLQVIYKEQLCWILWERLPAAIDLTRGWKPLPQISFLVTWAYRISAKMFMIEQDVVKKRFVIPTFFSTTTYTTLQYLGTYWRKSDRCLIFSHTTIDNNSLLLTCYIISRKRYDWTEFCYTRSAYSTGTSNCYFGFVGF